MARRGSRDPSANSAKPRCRHPSGDKRADRRNSVCIDRQSNTVVSRASDLARAGQHRLLGGRVLAALSHHALHLGRTAEAVDLASAALIGTRQLAPPAATAMLAAMEACAAAANEGGLAGHAARAYRDLREPAQADTGPTRGDPSDRTGPSRRLGPGRPRRQRRCCRSTAAALHARRQRRRQPGAADRPQPIGGHLPVRRYRSGSQDRRHDAHSVTLVGTRVSGLRPVVDDEPLALLRIPVDRPRSLVRTTSGRWRAASAAVGKIGRRRAHRQNRDGRRPGSGALSAAEECGSSVSSPDSGGARCSRLWASVSATENKLRSIQPPLLMALTASHTGWMCRRVHSKSGCGRSLGATLAGRAARSCDGRRGTGMSQPPVRGLHSPAVSGLRRRAIRGTWPIVVV